VRTLGANSVVKSYSHLNFQKVFFNVLVILLQYGGGNSLRKDEEKYINRRILNAMTLPHTALKYFFFDFV
jgi:hypothetical protein